MCRASADTRLPEGARLGRITAMVALIGSTVLLSDCPRDAGGRRERGLLFLPSRHPSYIPTASFQADEREAEGIAKARTLTDAWKDQALVVSGLCEGFGSRGGRITET